MIVLIDLDGTLVNTAYSSFKPMKDGLVETRLSEIPIIYGAREFISQLQGAGHVPLIVSDSHPRYVRPLAEQVFGVPALPLADKPNIIKTLNYLIGLGYDVQDKDNFIVIGDTWLDIELGRGLNLKTVLTQFYTANEIEERDGIGKTWSYLKSGPTFVAKTYNQILNIIQNPIRQAWAAEAGFQGESSVNAIRLNDLKGSNVLTLFRSLGRQEVGECDCYGIAAYYTEFQREGRSQQSLEKLAKSVQHYLQHVISSSPDLHWDYLAYVADKATTNPPNKMGDFFSIIESDVPKIQILQWTNNVDGSIRDRANYKDRRDFIHKHLSVIPGVDLNDKSIIIIDDQFTSGGTAYEITNLLRGKGAKNILFLTLFFMTSLVNSNKTCSSCGKPMQLKIRKSDGVKFFSCTPPKFRGEGCGHIENIV